ncbi:hypothetical protein Tco_0445361, partial [Tanacetum coccineum]
VHELKTEMHEDFEYVESLKKEIDELESKKADFSNIYDLLLEECVSKDVICSYLHSLSDLNAHTRLQCLYLHKMLKECECLAEQLSKQTETDLKAQKQDKNIAIIVNPSTSVSNHNISAYQVKDKVVAKQLAVKFTKKEVEDHHSISSISKKTKSVTAYNDSSNSRTSNVNVVCAECGKCVFNSNHDACVSKYFEMKLQCPTCKKCLYSANHDECVLEYLSRLNPRASAQNKDAKSHKTTKRYMPVEKSSASKKPERQIPTGHRFSNKKTTTVPEKTMNPRSCLRWKPTGRIFSNVRLRWIPTGKLLNSCTGKVDSEPAHGSIVDIPHIHACKQTLGLSAGTSFNGQKQQRIDLNADALYNEKQENLRVWLLKLLISKKPVPECSGLVLHQMMSDHNSSDLAPQRQMVSAENNTSGPVPQCLVLHQMTSDHNRSEPSDIAMAEDNSHKVVRLGINPMIQPEPEDLPKDNPKLEIAVLRWQSALASEY